ncbi:formate--tetrahydrofolate ligase, partial [Klebsiella pneumoniae]|nr:formate--tetrahydrofolate ligase [Klebsiella pneumoniae]
AERTGVAIAEADVWAKGGEGATELATTLLDNLTESTSTQLYDPANGIEASIETIAREIYRADDVQYSAAALRDLKMLKDNGF